MVWSYGARHKRLYTHLCLALVSLVSYFLTALIKPDWSQPQLITFIFGYLSLLLMVITLLIGPLRLLLWPKQKKGNPVNINLRRDAGIWAGLTGLLHATFSIQVHMQGQVWLYFFKQNQGGQYLPLLNLFGISNYLGVLASLILVLLLVLSNDFSLRRLKRRRWKFWQRFNYLLFLLAIAHTLGYIINQQGFFTALVLILTIVVLTGQAIGFYLYHSRHKVQQ